jgi:hypothetical protein
VRAFLDFLVERFSDAGVNLVLSNQRM